MKTLILNGSTRKNGDTQALIEAFTGALTGEVLTLSYFDHLSPCLDCRRCWERPGCAVNDKMQQAYPFLAECDHVALASPIWFSSLSGPLLNMASRMQTYFAGRFFRGEPEVRKPKNGVLLLTGAEPGTECGPIQTAVTIMKHMNVRRPLVATICSMHTNEVPAKEDREALRATRDAAKTLNQLYHNI